MVWFYGGAYTEGGNSMPFADGSKLAAKGAVIVAVNYRLGAFGFLSHPDLTTLSGRNGSGNQALSDGVAALQWVKANIAAFGGDPNNVTIFGQSAGACVTAALTGSPVGQGLFHKAISQSGAWSGLSATPMGTRENAEKQTIAAEKAGIKSFADLQALPADQVAKFGRGQGIIIDGWIVPRGPVEDLRRGPPEQGACAGRLEQGRLWRRLRSADERWSAGSRALPSAGATLARAGPLGLSGDDRCRGRGRPTAGQVLRA